MESSFTQFLNIFIGILVIVNPLSSAPVFISITEGQSKHQKNITAFTSSAVSCLILIGSSLIGESILTFFGVSIASFRIAGGILLLITALSMIKARRSLTKQTHEEELEAVEKDNVAIVPLAIPLLAGPGAISGVILYSNELVTISDRTILILICILISFLSYITFRLSASISNSLGKTGMNIITRLFGVLLATLGIEFIARGVGVLLPGLVK